MNVPDTFALSGKRALSFGGGLGVEADGGGAFDGEFLDAAGMGSGRPPADIAYDGCRGQPSPEQLLGSRNSSRPYPERESLVLDVPVTVEGVDERMQFGHPPTVGPENLRAHPVYPPLP
jgi:hypothetical protein